MKNNLLDLELSKDWYLRSVEFRENINPTYTGPTSESNWLIPGRLLVGGYPGSYYNNPLETKKIQEALINSGIDTFVCLNQEYGKKNHIAYANSLNFINLFKEISEKNFNKEKNFIIFPIVNMQTTNNKKVIDLCKILYKKIKKGEKIYIHCSGGHGRTGTISAILLCMLYKITPDDAFEYMQYCHDQRSSRYTKIFYNREILDNETNNGIEIKYLFVKGQVPTPQTSSQRKQVRDIVRTISENNIRDLNKNLIEEKNFLNNIKNNGEKNEKKQYTLKFSL